MPNILSTKILFISDKNPSMCHHLHLTDEETEVQGSLIICTRFLVSSGWCGEIDTQVCSISNPYCLALCIYIYITSDCQNGQLRQENKNKQLPTPPKKTQKNLGS